MATINKDSRTVPVLQGGGSVHVDYVIGDIRTISVNGGEHVPPDDDGNINIHVPPTTIIDDQLDLLSQNPVANMAVTAALAKKVDRGEMSQKADASDVETALEQKADKYTVSTQMAQKADASDVETALEQKADKYTVSMQMEQKADKNIVSTQMAQKLNRSDIVQTSGNDPGKVMSQKAVSQELNHRLTWDDVRNDINCSGADPTRPISEFVGKVLLTGLQGIGSSLANVGSTVAALADTDGRVHAVKGRAALEVEIVGGVVKVWGASKLIEAGYVPYLFRWTTKRNRKRNVGERVYGPVRKGWHVYGSARSVMVDDDNNLLFAIDDPAYVHSPSEGYSAEICYLVRPHVSEAGEVKVAWGRSGVLVAKREGLGGAGRMVRLRYGIGFGKPHEHGCKRVSELDMITPIEEFSAVYNPHRGVWCFSK